MTIAQNSLRSMVSSEFFFQILGAQLHSKSAGLAMLAGP